ncbi:MAG: 5'/3'-nucleotidase SurE [Armatimonadota bacterium]
MRILITNDDGVHAPGLLALYRALRPLGQVTAIAPERPRSACGHAITLHKPLRLRPVEMPDGAAGYASNGTPADCVALGASEHLGGPPDLVVSGINLGPNLGVDMTYSGTVAAAMEAAICGLPSFAISVASYQQPIFGPAAEFAAYLAQALVRRAGTSSGFLNVNVPAVAKDQIHGVRITHQGRIRYTNRIERRTDPRGGAYYWLTGERVDRSEHAGGDFDAVEANWISVTPVRLDLTDEPALDSLAAWDLRWPG